MNQILKKEKRHVFSDGIQAVFEKKYCRDADQDDDGGLQFIFSGRREVYILPVREGAGIRLDVWIYHVGNRQYSDHAYDVPAQRITDFDQVKFISDLGRASAEGRSASIKISLVLFQRGSEDATDLAMYVIGLADMFLR